MDLITAIFVSHVKILACVRLKADSKSIQVKVPNLDTFLHKIIITIAEKIYYNPDIILKKKEYVIEIISETIEETIRNQIPIDKILTEYLAGVFDDDTEAKLLSTNPLESGNEKTVIIESGVIPSGNFVIYCDRSYYTSEVTWNLYQTDNPDIKISGGMPYAFNVEFPSLVLGEASDWYPPYPPTLLPALSTIPDSSNTLFSYPIPTSYNALGGYGSEYKHYSGIVFPSYYLNQLDGYKIIGFAHHTRGWFNNGNAGWLTGPNGQPTQKEAKFMILEQSGTLGVDASYDNLYLENDGTDNATVVRTLSTDELADYNSIYLYREYELETSEYITLTNNNNNMYLVLYLHTEHPDDSSLPVYSAGAVPDLISRIDASQSELTGIPEGYPLNSYVYWVAPFWNPNTFDLWESWPSVATWGNTLYLLVESPDGTRSNINVNRLNSKSINTNPIKLSSERRFKDKN